MAAGQGWDTLFEAAVVGVDAMPAVNDAVAWANDLVKRIEEAGA